MFCGLELKTIVAGCRSEIYKDIIMSIRKVLQLMILTFSATTLLRISTCILLQQAGCSSLDQVEMPVNCYKHFLFFVVVAISFFFFFCGIFIYIFFTHLFAFPFTLLIFYQKWDTECWLMDQLAEALVLMVFPID